MRKLTLYRDDSTSQVVFENVKADRLRAAAVSFEGQRAWHANAIDGDCEPHDSWQLEMDDASKAAVEAADLLCSPPIPDGRIAREALKDAISQLLPFAEDGDQPAISACIDKCRAAIRVLALPDQRVSGWQDIETAPKDGKPVDLWTRHVDGGESRFPSMVHVTGGNFEGWQHAIGRVLMERLAEVYTPTHWRPLPLPPERGSEVLRTTAAPADATGEQ